jgi:RHS repeat-associated protein
LQKSNLPTQPPASVTQVNDCEFPERQPYKFGGKEYDEMFGMNQYDFEARQLDAMIPRFTTMDPLAEKYYSISPYAYCGNNPVNAIDPTGCDSVHVLDQGTRPLDNGTAGQTYTADVYVTQNGMINGPYSGSSYPNSVSNSNNDPVANTVDEGEHQYDNASGHKGGTQQGLNLVDANGNRTVPGTDPNGNAVTMTYVNVHSGVSDNGNATSRGSLGCITINPSDAVPSIVPPSTAINPLLRR